MKNKFEKTSEISKDRDLLYQRVSVMSLLTSSDSFGPRQGNGFMCKVNIAFVGKI